MTRGSRGFLWAMVFLCASSNGVVAASPRGAEREGAFITGKVLSYAWLLNDEAVKGDLESRQKALKIYGAKPGYRDYDQSGNGDVFSTDVLSNRGSGLSTWGTNYDAILSMGLRSKRDGLGTVYGADFSLAVPAGASGGSLIYGHQGTGSRVFADTVVGNFSLGYQEGVESTMKVDVLGAISGESGSSWGRYLRCFLRYASGVPFHMYPGLYSENLFRTMGSSERINGFSAKFKDVLNSLPMRLSYTSAQVGGFTVGFSYSLSGYRDDLFRGRDFELRDVIGKLHKEHGIGEQDLWYAGDDHRSMLSYRVGRKVEVDRVVSVGMPRFDLGPVYKNIFSGAMRYDWEDESSGIKLGLSVGGEYASPKKASDIAPSNYKGTGYHVEYENLAAVSGGLEASYSGLKAAFSAGYLGNSGRSKMYVSEGLQVEVPYSKKKSPTYYTAASLAYTVGDFSASVVYFASRLVHSPLVDVKVKALHNVGEEKDRYVPEASYDGNNSLQDVVVGIGYNVYRKGNSSLEMFANCHLFFSEHEFVEHAYSVDEKRFNQGGGRPHKNTHDGVVAVLGLKYAF